MLLTKASKNEKTVLNHLSIFIQTQNVGPVHQRVEPEKKKKTGGLFYGGARRNDSTDEVEVLFSLPHIRPQVFF